MLIAAKIRSFLTKRGMWSRPAQSMSRRLEQWQWPVYVELVCSAHSSWPSSLSSRLTSSTVTTHRQLPSTTTTTTLSATDVFVRWKFGQYAASIFPRRGNGANSSLIACNRIQILQRRLLPGQIVGIFTRARDCSSCIRSGQSACIDRRRWRQTTDIASSLWRRLD